MTFLAPSTAILGAAIAAALLVLLYILKLLRRPLRVSSVKFWPTSEDDSQVNSPFRRFRPSLLFFLHLLILALAVLALSRPAITLDAPGGDRVIMLIDTSASMGTLDPDADGSRLERARERASTLAAAITRSSGRSVCVIPFAASARAATGFTTSRSSAVAAIEGAQQTDQPGDIGAALKLAGAMLGDSEQGQSASIIVLSDGIFGAPSAAEPLSAPCPLIFERIGPGEAAPENVGITALAARRDPGDPALVRIFAELALSVAARSSVTFTLALDGEPVLTRTIDAPAPGVARIVPLPLTLRTSEGGILTLALGTPDALGADNSASLVLAKPASPRIVLVQPRGPTVAGVVSADWLLADVLEELRPASLRRMSAQEFSASPPGPADADLIVLDRSGTIKLPAIPSLSFGDFAQLPGLVTTERAEPLTTPAILWEREHPALAGLSLDALVVEQRVRIEIADKASARAIVSGRDGPLVLAGEDRGVRRIAAVFELSRSNWPLLPEFPVFVAGAVDALTLRAQSASGRSTSTAQPLKVEASAAGDVLASSGSDTLSAHAGAAGELSFGLPVRAGVYTISGATPPVVAVNMTSATESLIGAANEITVGEEKLAAAGAARAQRELWPVCVMALAALLTLEWLAFGLKSRQ